MPFARASELDRLLSCVGSAVLPRQDTRTLGVRKAAEWGTSVHSWLETGIVTSPGLGERITLSGTNRERLWPRGLHEITLALNVVTGDARRYYGASEGRDAWKTDFDDEWITGTLDFVGELFDLPWVDDLKTGRFAAWNDYKAQQSFYVLAWSRYRYEETRESRSTITHWPRYPKHLPPTREGRVLSLDYLGGFAKQLTQLRDDILRAQDAGAALNPGKQCVYCPSRSHCPQGIQYNG